MVNQNFNTEEFLYSELVDSIANSNSFSNINTDREPDLKFYYTLTNPSNFNSGKIIEDQHYSHTVNLFNDPNFINKIGFLTSSIIIIDPQNQTGNKPDGKFNSYMKISIVMNNKKETLVFNSSNEHVIKIDKVVLENEKYVPETYILDIGKYEFTMNNGKGKGEYRDYKAKLILDIKSLEDRIISIYFESKKKSTV